MNLKELAYQGHSTAFRVMLVTLKLEHQSLDNVFAIDNFTGYGTLRFELSRARALTSIVVNGFDVNGNAISETLVSTTKEVLTTTHKYAGFPAPTVTPNNFSGETCDVIAPDDISEDVNGVSDISTSLDYPRLTEYRIGESTVTLNDPDGTYKDTDIDTECRIEAGFVVDGQVHTETIFSGNVIKVSQNARQATTQLLVSNAFNTLFRDTITDVGIERRFGLEEEESDDIHGFYPIAPFVGPASKGSTEVDKTLNTPLTEVNALASIGSFNSNNYLLTNEGIKTEGGPVAGAGTGYPQISMKSPYRHRLFEQVIKEILESVGIFESDVALPNVVLDNHFASQGRFGYEVLSTSTFIGSSAGARWTGYITDFIWDTDKYYILLNAHRGDLRSRSTLFSFNPTTYEYEVLFQSQPPSTTFGGTEFWKLAKLGNTIAILCTDSGIRNDETTFNIIVDYRSLQPSLGSYDAAQAGNQVYIQYYDIVNDTASVVVDKDNSYRAQLAHNYLMGATADSVLSEYQHDFNELLRGTLPTRLPDTRRNFVWHNNLLHYAYIDNVNTDMFGVATCNLAGDTTASVIELQTDGSNHTGIAFWIDGSSLYCGITRRKELSSEIKVFSVAV